MTNNDLTRSTIASIYQTNQDMPEIPSTPLVGVSPTFILQQQVQRLNTQVQTITSTPTPDGTPLQVTGVSATESPKIVNAQTYSNVGVSFTVNPSDDNFSHVLIWFTGYNGNANAQAVAQATASPAGFLVDTTGETVTVTVQSVSFDGSTADFSLAPTVSLLLDGVTSAPSAPSISQSLVATPVGYQFSFNQLAGLTADLIDGYQVYRNTTNNSSTASKFAYFKHNPVNSAVVVVQDNGVPNGTTFFYWVSAVNTKGLESSKTAAQSGTVTSGSTFGSDGNPHLWSGKNLVWNNDLSIYSQPTGFQDFYASSTRSNDNDILGNPQLTPNGWTRNFENLGNGEGVIYRSANPGMSTAGSFIMVMQDRQSSTNDLYSTVSDAFPVSAGKQYRVSAVVAPGSGSGFPTHAAWYFRIIFYKVSTTDFSRTSTTLSAVSVTGTSAGTGFNSGGGTGTFDIASGSTLSGTLTPGSTVTAPSDAAFARVAFYHWNDGTTVASAWNLLFGDVKVQALTVDGEANFFTSTILNGQGGMVPGQAFSYTFSSTSTSITATWSSASLLRADGSNLTINSGSHTFSSLTPSTTYWLYAYLDVINDTVGFANGTPPGTSASSVVAAQAALDGRVPLSPLSVTIPASGTGPTGGGGDNSTCPEAAELIQEQAKGAIRADAVQWGDYILGYSFTQQKDIYRRVVGIQTVPSASWRIVQGHRVSPSESVYVNGKWDAAFRVPGATFDTMIGKKVMIWVEADEHDEHNYYLVLGNRLLIHNFVIERC